MAGKTSTALKDFFLVAIVSTLYLLTAAVLIGFRFEQLVLVAIFSITYLATSNSKKWMTGFSVFLIYWIIFDFMKAFPNYLYQEVHIQSLYLAEKKWFGIYTAGELLTPSEYWLKKKSGALDALTGLFYLCWVPVPLSIAAYLFLKDRNKFLQFTLNFFVLNLVGWTIYYTFPAAPPWYVQQYGFEFIPNTPGSEAGLNGFDQFFGVSLFQTMYVRSSNVFAAMPSMHSAYPLFVLFYGLKFKLGRINIFLAIITLGIWFSAVYTSHHYVIDVLAGIATTIGGITAFELMMQYSKIFIKFFGKFEALIEK